MTEAIVEGKMPAPSLAPQSYIDEVVVFALEYPASWTAPQTMAGLRGSRALPLSAPEIADLETLPPGATRLTVDVNPWDPQNDRSACVENRKTAWQATGFTMLEEQPLRLDEGLPAVRFSIQSTAGLPVEYLFAAIRGRYVTISGEGDLQLVREIMQYLRPIS